MGYYTSHTLDIQQEKPYYDKKVLIKLFRENYEDARFAIDEDGEAYEEVKWYSSVNNLTEFSINFPHAIFVLDCLGEDGERWRNYVSNGKSQEVRPKLIYPEFDWELLK